MFLKFFKRLDILSPYLHTNLNIRWLSSKLFRHNRKQLAQLRIILLDLGKEEQFETNGVFGYSNIK
jgi:hypothetical protein